MANVRNLQHPEPAQGVGPTPSNMTLQGCPRAGPHALSPRDSARETRGAPVILPLVIPGRGALWAAFVFKLWGYACQPPIGDWRSAQRLLSDSGADEDLGDELAFARGRSAVCFEIFAEAMCAMVHLGRELANVDTRLEAENRRLEDE